VKLLTELCVGKRISPSNFNWVIHLQGFLSFSVALKYGGLVRFMLCSLDITSFNVIDAYECPSREAAVHK